VQPIDDPYEKHLHVRITFDDDGRELRFVDQRTFGGLHLDTLETDAVTGRLVPTSMVHIAADPLEEVFDVDRLAMTLRRRSTGIKRALLDQTVVSGIGNIYADEALWRSRLHYARSTSVFTRVQVRGLIAHTVDVMTSALDQGGTSFDSLYVDVNGSSGYFERSLDAYGREGRPCHRCGRLIVREAFMNRSSFRCPSCQRVPRSAYW
jgi:formamidopyrimidine-DNA glycosylase